MPVLVVFGSSEETYNSGPPCSPKLYQVVKIYELVTSVVLFASAIALWATSGSHATCVIVGCLAFVYAILLFASECPVLVPQLRIWETFQGACNRLTRLTKGMLILFGSIWLLVLCHEGWSIAFNVMTIIAGMLELCLYFGKGGCIATSEELRPIEPIDGENGAGNDGTTNKDEESNHGIAQGGNLPPYQQQ